MMPLSENVEEYLEFLYMAEERGIRRVRINEVAEGLGIAPPSAVQMLQKMHQDGLVYYEARVGVALTSGGRKLASNVIRNHRLAELLLKEILEIRVDEEAVCGLEHHISGEIANAVCTRLNHPRKCPHGNDIPLGSCCR
jgi:DtxR family Mn-dependent transcriptional regulator